MGKKKDKQKLYEYQYTTPNKTVVKEVLPAVQKPSGLRSYQEKKNWGAIVAVYAIWKLIGVLDILSYASPIRVAKNLLIFGGLLGFGIYQFLKGKNYVGRVERYSRYMKLMEQKQFASIEELARMLGGTMITEAVRQNAREMKSLAAQKKQERV